MLYILQAVFTDEKLVWKKFSCNAYMYVIFRGGRCI